MSFALSSIYVISSTILIKNIFSIEEIPGGHLSFGETGIKVNKLQWVALHCVPILRYHPGYQP
jgi:hypothetical protein